MLLHSILRMGLEPNKSSSREGSGSFGLSKSPKKTQISHLTLPETNSKFAPENGWLEYYC